MGLKWSNGHPSKRMFIPFIFLKSCSFSACLCHPLGERWSHPRRPGSAGSAQLGRLRCQSPESQVSHAGWQRTTAAGAHLRGERGSSEASDLSWLDGWSWISSICWVHPWRVDPWGSKASHVAQSFQQLQYVWTLVDLGGPLLSHGSLSLRMNFVSLSRPCKT